MIEILNDRAAVLITGEDAQKFLQGMTTNDVVKHSYSYNYLLNNQGKYLFDFFVFQKSENTYIIDIHQDSVDLFLKRLALYKLRSRFETEDVSSQYNVLYSKAKIDSDVEYSFQDPRYKKLRYRSLIKSSNINNVKAPGKNLYVFDKYKHTIIDGNSDLIFERSMPAEYGAEELHAIDFRKGCYIGQEVVSRVKYQGVVRKKIFKLIFCTKISSDLSGAEITDINGNELGVVCSNYENQAIALLREELYLGLDRKIALVVGQLVDIAIPGWRRGV